MSSVNIVFLNFTNDAPLVKELSSFYQGSDNFNVEVIASGQEVNQFLATTGNGILLFKVSSKKDLQESVAVLKANRKAIRKGIIKPACITGIENKKVDAILRKYGCQDVLDPNLKGKTLTFKLDFWSKPIKKQIEKQEAEEKLLLKKANAQKSEDPKEKKSEFTLVEPLSLESDFWLVKSKSDYKKILRRFLIRLLGPSPYVGSWIELETQPGDKQPTWKWVLKDHENKDYIVDDGAWFFYGAKPEFDWKIKRWSFASDHPHLYFYTRKGEVFSRFKYEDNTVNIAENSEFANIREEMILQTCDSKFNFEGEKAKDEGSQNLEGDADNEVSDGKVEGHFEKENVAENLKGKGSAADSMGEDPLSGKGSEAEHFGDEPISGKGSAADSMGENPLSGKGSSADHLGDDPLSGKGSAAERHGDDPLSGKGSSADHFGDDPLSGKGSVADSMGENPLSGKGSSADHFGDDPLSGKGSVADSMGENPLSGKGSSADHFGDDPLSGKGSAAERHGDDPLSGKGSSADHFGDDPLSGKSSNADRMKNMDGKGSAADRHGDDPLSGKGSSADHFGDDPLSGKGANADRMKNMDGKGSAADRHGDDPLSGKGSSADHFGDDPLSGKAANADRMKNMDGKGSAADRHGDDPLSGKGSNADHFGDDPLSGKGANADRMKNMDGKGSAADRHGDDPLSGKGSSADHFGDDPLAGDAGTADRMGNMSGKGAAADQLGKEPLSNKRQLEKQKRARDIPVDKKGLEDLAERRPDISPELLDKLKEADCLDDLIPNLDDMTSAQIDEATGKLGLDDDITDALNLSKPLLDLKKQKDALAGLNEELQASLKNAKSLEDLIPNLDNLSADELEQAKKKLGIDDDILDALNLSGPLLAEKKRKEALESLPVELQEEIKKAKSLADLIPNIESMSPEEVAAAKKKLGIDDDIIDSLSLGQPLLSEQSKATKEDEAYFNEKKRRAEILKKRIEKQEPENYLEEKRREREEKIAKNEEAAQEMGDYFNENKRKAEEIEKREAKIEAEYAAREASKKDELNQHSVDHGDIPEEKRKKSKIERIEEETFEALDGGLTKVEISKPDLPDTIGSAKEVEEEEELDLPQTIGKAAEEVSLESGELKVILKQKTGAGNKINFLCEFEDFYIDELVVKIAKGTFSLGVESLVEATVSLNYNGSKIDVVCDGIVVEIENLSGKQDTLIIDINSIDEKKYETFMKLYEGRQTSILEFMELARGY